MILVGKTSGFKISPGVSHLGGLGLFADEFIGKGSIIFLLSGTLTTTQTKYSIQITKYEHLEGRGLHLLMNHSCQPNAYIDSMGYRVIAEKDIEPGEEIRFDYRTTESRLAEPFTCNECNGPHRVS